MVVRLRKYSVYYLLAVFWVGIIFYLSSFHDLKTGTEYVFWEIFLRKLAHAGEFTVLAFLIFRIFHRAHELDAKRSFLSSLLIVLVFGGLDEFHQFFVSGREARVFDIFIDVFGSSLGLYLLTWKERDKNYIFRFIFLILIFLGVIVGKAWENVRIYGEYIDDPKNQEIPTSAPQEKLLENLVIDSSENPKETIPTAFQIKNVPFTVQAPLGKWDEIHEEACEEASVIMLEYFRKGKALTPDVAEKEIQKTVRFEIQKYGDYKDSDASQIADLAKDFYGLNLKVIYDFSLEDLKKYLSQGRLIIIPAAGRLLGNPYFTPPGPLYHNLVLIGYDGDHIIVNDPGTKRGQNYVYQETVLWKAIHDFPGKKEDIEKGRKAALVLE